MIETLILVQVGVLISTVAGWIACRLCRGNTIQNSEFLCLFAIFWLVMNIAFALVYMEFKPC